MLSIALGLVLVAAPGHRPKVAVLDLEDTSGTQAANARLLTQVVVGEVAAQRQLDVVSSAQITQLLGFERQKQLMGCKEDSACLAELAGALGADYLVTGQLGRLGSRYRLDLNLLDARKARLLASQGDFVAGGEDALADASVRMVRALLGEGQLLQAPEPAGGLTATSTAPAAGMTHTAAYVVWGVGAALAVGAGVMTGVTVTTYNAAVKDFREGKPNTRGPQLGWMGPVTDGLWAGTIATAVGGTLIYFMASPTPDGSGGELGVRGAF